MSNTRTIDAKCRTCGEEVRLIVDLEDLFLWRNGALVQRAFPYLSPGDRELLVSGKCGACFDRLFTDDVDTTLTGGHAPKED